MSRLELARAGGISDFRTAVRRGAEKRHKRTGEIGSKFQQKATVAPVNGEMLFLG